MKRIAHYCLVVCFLLGTNLPFLTHATSTAYFIAVNDTILPLHSGNIPIWVDGYICLPYTVFDENTTGSSLGTSSSYQKSAQLVTVYTEKDTLIFDLEAGYTINGATQSLLPFRGEVENGIPYLPMTIICNFFGITFSYHSTDYGSMVRLEKGNTNLNHARFLLENDLLMENMLEEFSREPVVVLPEEPEEEEVLLEDTPLCLAFELGQVDMVDTLENWKITGLFLVTETQLREEGNMIRKILAMGHQLGFLLTATGGEEALAEVARCNELLRQQSRRSTEIVSGGSLNSFLAQQGYVVWQGGTGRSLSNPETLVETLPQGVDMAYLTLKVDSSTLNLWTQWMNLLEEGQFLLQIPLEGKL